MKNYKFVLPALCASLLLGSGAQAAHIKEHTAAASATPVSSGPLPAVRLGGEYKFVDTDVPAPSTAAGTVGLHGSVAPAARAGAGLDKPSAQGFAGGVVATENTAAAKAGLANAPAAAERIAEPATELLLLVALSALAIAVRRQSPT